MVMIFKLIGELKDAIVWPIMRIGNEGGLIFIATHLTQQPAERIQPDNTS
jgi:hypothetical protein